MEQISIPATALEVIAGQRICLLVESRAFCAGLKEMLLPLGAKLHFLHEPDTGHSSMVGLDPDYIIIDGDLPAGLNLTLIRKLRTSIETKRAPIMMLLSNENCSGLSELAMAGVDAFILKSDIRERFILHMLLLVRMKSFYIESQAKSELLKRNELIWAVRHELANVLAILEGRSNKLGQNHPFLLEDIGFQSIQKNIARLFSLQRKISENENSEDESGGNKSKSTKIA